MEAIRPKVHGDDNIVTKCGQLLYYIPNFLGQLSDSYYDQCARLDNWQERQIFLFGRWSKIPRLTLWYSMSGKSYTYSGMTMRAKPYPPVIEKISNQVTEFSDLQFNSVLLNRFRNGSDKIGWHSDNEKCLGEIINIATGKKTKVGELVDLCFQLCEKKPDLRISGATSGDLHGIFADTNKMKEILNVSKTLSLELGLESMIKWMRAIS